MKRYFSVLLLCICMMAAILVCLNRQISDNLLRYVSFRDEVTGRELKPFYEETENRYSLFLPSYTSPEKVNADFSIGGGVHRIYL